MTTFDVFFSCVAKDRDKIRPVKVKDSNFKEG